MALFNRSSSKQSKESQPTDHFYCRETKYEFVSSHILEHECTGPVEFIQW